MLKKSLQDILLSAVGDLGREYPLPAMEDREVTVEYPERSEHGDYSTSLALKIAKKIGKNPLEVALSLQRILMGKNGKLFEKIEVAGPGFLNFFLSARVFLGELDGIVRGKRARAPRAAKRVIVIEYSSPNIAKPFGIGHLRSTIIGQALYNLYAFLGYKCVGINHLGDWGTPHGKIMYQLYTRVLRGKSPKEQSRILRDLRVSELERLYVEFTKEAEGRPERMEEARSWFKKLETGDKEARAIWKAIRRVSMKEFAKVYAILRVDIDCAIGESFYEKRIEGIVKEFKKKHLARESQGALIVPFANDELPPAMLVKSDGTTTYFARDLAAMRYRLRRWRPAVLVIETGAEQDLHFQQVFGASRMASWITREKLVHVGHGLYRRKEGKLSTRKGDTIHLEEVLEEAIARARAIIAESETARSLSAKERESVARAVGIGGVKYNDLAQHPRSDIVFDWDKVLNLKGNSASYIQYTRARCQSILAKAASSGVCLPRVFSLLSMADESSAMAPEERALLRLLARFEETVAEAAEKFSPHVLCGYAFELAQAFNLFYGACPVLQSEKNQRMFRVALTKGVSAVLKNSLGLLGIDAPDRM